MYIISTASADTYITNKIVDGARAEDANVGRAGTLDLFKLYGETISGSSDSNIELSRILVKFDLNRVKSLSSSSLDINSPSFKARMRLHPVETNLPVPRDFTISVFPLARSFDEGDGRDVASFSDVDACNYLSSSTGVSWTISGAYSSGVVGDVNVDYYSSGDLLDGQGTRSLESKQVFIAGNEDLFVDVTDVVSATISGIVPDHGFILSFTSSQETDDVTRFVKRFASRHVTQAHLRPRLEICSNDSIFDAHVNATFDSSGTLYLRNFAGSEQANMMSASFPVTGSDCLHIVLSTGSFSTTITASQQMIGDSFVVGSYSGSFYISAQDQSIVSGSIKLSDYVSASGSVIFSEKWQSIDNSVVFFSTFLTCSSPSRTAFNAVAKQLRMYSTNLRSKFFANSSYRIRVFSYDSNYESSSTRVPKPTKSATPRSYYRVRDVEGRIYVPFETENDGTRLSFDEGGLFFDLYTDNLPRGKLLTLDYFVIDKGSEYIVEDKNARFTVE